LIGVLDLLTFTLLVLIIGIGLTATVLLARGYWRAIADELDIIQLSHRGGRRFLLGVINGPILFIINLIIFKTGHPLLGLIMLFALIILILLGLIAEMALIGRRVLALRGLDCSLFAQTLAGGLTITAIALLPFIGQAIFFIILCQSFGTSIYWLFKRKKIAVGSRGSGNVEEQNPKNL
jgi:hypothetical protein